MSTFKSYSVFNKHNIKNFLWIAGLILLEILLYGLAKMSPFEWRSPLTEIDKNIPFVSCFSVFYIMYFPMLITVPIILLKYSKKNFKIYMWSAMICTIICSTFCFFYPTIMERANLVSTDIFTQLVAIIYQMDEPALCSFPSAHCMFSTLFIIASFGAYKHIKPLHLFFICIISGLIIASTVFIKQHAFIDIIGGVLIAVIVYPAVRLYFIKQESHKE